MRFIYLKYITLLSYAMVDQYRSVSRQLLKRRPKYKDYSGRSTFDRHRQIIIIVKEDEMIFLSLLVLLFENVR